MLPLALTLLAASALLLALALRGRTTARGLFCRRCRFDLEGLDPARENPACPECGRDLAAARATSPVVRRRSTAGLVAAALLALAAAVLLTAAIPAARTYMLPHLPDPALAALDRLGLHGTHPEILARLQDPTRPRTSALAARIDDALAAIEQQPAQAPWPDLERIVSAMHGDKLDEPQLTRLLSAMYTTEYKIRNAPPPGKDWVPYGIDVAASFDLAYISATLGLPTPSRHEIRFSHKAEVSLDPERAVWSRVPVSMGHTTDWLSGSSHTPSMRSGVHRDRFRALNSDSTFSVRWQQSIELTDKATNAIAARTQTTHTQEVRPSTNPEHGTTLVEDPVALAQVAESISITRMSVADAPLTTGSLVAFGSLFEMQARDPPATAAAYTVLILEADGSRTPLTTFHFDQTNKDPQIMRSFGSNAHPTGDDAPTWNARFVRWVADGTVDIILVPDPWLAWENFLPDRLLAGELIIRDVPVEAVPPLAPGEQRAINRTMYPAQIHDPSTGSVP